MEGTDGSLAPRLSLFKNMSTRSPAPPLAARYVESSPASFPHAATGNVSINLSRSQDPFAPFRRVPRSNLPSIRYPAPLLGSSSATSSSFVVPPLSGIPLHFTCVGKTASNGQFQIPCPLPSPNRLDPERDPQVVSAVRKGRGRRRRKWRRRRWIGVDRIAMARGPDGGGEKMGGGREGSASVHLCLHQNAFERKRRREGGRAADFSCKSPSYGGNQPPFRTVLVDMRMGWNFIITWPRVRGIFDKNDEG